MEKNTSTIVYAVLLLAAVVGLGFIATGHDWAARDRDVEAQQVRR